MTISTVAHGFLAVSLLTALFGTGCGSARARVFAQHAQVQVESAGKQPVAGAAIYINGELAQHTTTEGRANVQVQGVAGDKFQIAATCPEGFHLAATEAQQDIFVTPGIAAATPEFVFRCETTRRKATISVRAENGQNLPIRYLGRELGRTDAKGMGSVTIEAEQGDALEIIVDTSGSKKLHPQNPALTFHVGDGDGSFVFEQKFTVEKAKPAPRKASPTIPVRISS